MSARDWKAEEEARIRDMFSGMALMGELASQSNEDGQWSQFDSLAVRCFNIADAMMLERKKREAVS